jgi:hypothetical protein
MRSHAERGNDGGAGRSSANLDPLLTESSHTFRIFGAVEAVHDRHLRNLSYEHGDRSASI